MQSLVIGLLVVCKRLETFGVLHSKMFLPLAPNGAIKISEIGPEPVKSQSVSKNGLFCVPRCRHGKLPKHKWVKMH